MPSTSTDSHGYDADTGSPIIPGSNWLAQVGPDEAALAAIHPLPDPDSRTKAHIGDTLWTTPDHRRRPGWRVFGVYRRLFCQDCGRELERVRKHVPDNLVSWHVSDNTHRVYSGWQHSDRKIICGKCWAFMPHLPPHIREQRARLAQEA